MPLGRDRQIAKYNSAVSNVFSSSGDLHKLGSFFVDAGQPLDFTISGGTREERSETLYNLLNGTVGRLPIIVLHNEDLAIEGAVYRAWDAAFRQYSQEARPPLWRVNSRNPQFEPFDKMTDMEIITSIRQMAAKLNYTATPRLEQVVRAHIDILRQLSVPVTLTGFSYLCQFTDMGEFHDNIMALPCGQMEANRIWASMGAGSYSDNNQFDLFRTIISNLSSDAYHSGWSADNKVGRFNAIRAVREGATMLLSINDIYSNLLMEYLAEEMKLSCWTEYLLIIDGISIKNSSMINFLRHPNSRCHIGIISDNAIDMLGDDENAFLSIAERMKSIVIMKHNTGRVANVFSEMMGKYEHTKIESTTGNSRNFLSFFPRDTHTERRYIVENRYRVMPEEIIGLRQGQAIIFETEKDQIIYYN